MKLNNILLWIKKSQIPAFSPHGKTNNIVAILSEPPPNDDHSHNFVINYIPLIQSKTHSDSELLRDIMEKQQQLQQLQQKEQQQQKQQQQQEQQQQQQQEQQQQEQQEWEQQEQEQQLQREQQHQEQQQQEQQQEQQREQQQLLLQQNQQIHQLQQKLQQQQEQQKQQQVQQNLQLHQLEQQLQQQLQQQEQQHHQKHQNLVEKLTLAESASQAAQVAQHDAEKKLQAMEAKMNLLQQSVRRLSSSLQAATDQATVDNAREEELEDEVETLQTQVAKQDDVLRELAAKKIALQQEHRIELTRVRTLRVALRDVWGKLEQSEKARYAMASAKMEEETAPISNSDPSITNERPS